MKFGDEDEFYICKTAEIGPVAEDYHWVINDQGEQGVCLEYYEGGGLFKQVILPHEPELLVAIGEMISELGETRSG